MRIVVTEYPKSGGTWLVNMLGDAAGLPKRDIYINKERTGPNIHQHPWYAGTTDFDLPNACVIKSHELPGSPLVDFPTRFVHLIRDGRDVAVSRYHYEKDHAVRNGFRERFEEPWTTYVPRVAGEWAHYIYAWRGKNVVECRYEAFLEDPVGHLRQLLADLGIDCSAERVEQAVAANVKQRMRKAIDLMVVYNAFVRKGVKGDWRNHFREKDVAAFKQSAGGVLISLDYEPDDSWTCRPHQQDGLADPQTLAGPIPQCWCGGERLLPFSEYFLLCPACQTLVAREKSHEDGNRLPSEAGAFGKHYWLEHQEEELGQPNIIRRARFDLPERCLYWLQTLLMYHLPGGRLLDVGCGHGGFVYLAGLAGYDALGLELNPWVVDLARRTFDIPMLCGGIADQPLQPHSLDVIVLMDVLEHLADPLGTLARCLDLLKPAGIIMVQTPRFPAGQSYEALVEGEAAFLKPLAQSAHRFLYSQTSLQMLFRNLGCTHQEVQPAIQEDQDMCFLLSRQPLTPNSSDSIHDALQGTPTGRMVLALSDLELRTWQMKQQIRAGEEERVALLRVIEEQRNSLDLMQTRINELLGSGWRRFGRVLGLAKAASFEAEWFREPAEPLSA